jgi:hypothetical protein
MAPHVGTNFIFNLRKFRRQLCLKKRKKIDNQVRASPTGEVNEKTKLKTCPFIFCSFNLSFQCSRQPRSQNGCLTWEELFLQFHVEIAKKRLTLPTAIKIDVGQQYFIFF